jgi:hypothetical protein
VPVGGLCVVYIPELARVVVEAGRAGVDGERYPVADAYLSTSEIAFALQAVRAARRPAQPRVRSAPRHPYAPAQRGGEAAARRGGSPRRVR